MPVLTTVITHATGDVYPASDWNTYNRDDINYLITAGADLASAATIITTNEFHAVTGVTTIDNLSPVTPVAGQRIRLWIKGGPLTIRNNGGGTGNIRTIVGGDRAVAANEILEFVYNGATWNEVVPTARQLIAYTERNTNMTVNTIAEGAATTFITSAAFTSDGVTPVEVSFFVPAIVWGGAGVTGGVNLWLDGVDQGRLVDLALVGNASGDYPAGTVTRRVTPAAGSRTFSVRAWAGAANLVLQAGGGGAGVPLPAFLKIARSL